MKGEDQSAVRAALLGFRLPPSPFRLLLDPPAPGAWNMSVDEALLETAAADGQCTLRLYRWQEPTLSLGYFQAYDDRRQHAASNRSGVVRRPSGGGAILHDREVTYSLAIPSRHPLSVRRLECYEAVHLALVDVLAQWGIEATLATRSEWRSPDHLSLPLLLLHTVNFLPWASATKVPSGESATRQILSPST